MAATITETNPAEIMTTAASSAMIRQTKKFTSTGVNAESIGLSKESIITHVKAAQDFTIEDGIVTQVEFSRNEPSYPIIVIINGAGANGKDTLIEAASTKCSVLNLSSINPVREAVAVLINESSRFDGNTSLKFQDMETNSYRKFLHDVKEAWITFNDGPTLSLTGELQNTLDIQINGGECYDLIFMHIREADEIEKMKDIITNKFGLICITVLVRGLIDPSEYTNEGDAHVEDYTYDFTITNKYGSEDMFKLQSMLFAEKLSSCNSVLGISAYKLAIPSADVDVKVNTEVVDDSTETSGDVNVVVTARNDTFCTNDDNTRTAASE